MFELNYRKWLAKIVCMFILYVLAITVVPYSVGKALMMRKYDACMALKSQTGTEMYYSPIVDECFSVVRDQLYFPRTFIKKAEAVDE